jgi:SOS-response transcriptional repressor LexA
MTWWQRLAEIIETRGITPEHLAEVSGVPIKSVYGYLKGSVENPRGDVMRRLAAAARTTESYLRYGAATAPVAAASIRKIPLIKLNAFATLQVPSDHMSAWDGVSEVIAPSDTGDRCYAVEITDESGSPEFRVGDFLICDPTAGVEPGRVVVAVIPDATLAVFGRYKPHSRIKPDAGFTIEHVHPDYAPTTVNADNPGFVLARAIRHVRNI